MLYTYSGGDPPLMLAIRLDKETEERLAKLARRTGRTKAFYAREAILTHLQNLKGG